MSYIDIVFDGPPDHEAGRFVEVEDEDGASVNLGEWIDRGNGYWVLRIPVSPGAGVEIAERDELGAWRQWARIYLTEQQGSESDLGMRELLKDQILAGVDDVLFDSAIRQRDQLKDEVAQWKAEAEYQMQEPETVNECLDQILSIAAYAKELAEGGES